MLHLIERNKMIVTVKDEFYTVPEFAAISKKYAKKKNGDELVLREVRYLFFLCDYRSPYDGMDKEDRERESRHVSQLDSKWEPDKVTKAAVLRYKEFIKMIPSSTLLSTARRGLTIVNSSMENIITKIEKAVKEKEARQHALGTNLDNVKVDTKREISELLGFVDDFMKQVGNIPDKMKIIDKISEQVKKEESDSTILVGNKKKGNREDPDK